MSTTLRVVTLGLSGRLFWATRSSPTHAPRPAARTVLVAGALSLLLAPSPSGASTGSWLSEYELSVGATEWTDSGDASRERENARHIRNTLHISNLYAYGRRARVRAGAFVEVGQGGWDLPCI